MTDFRFVEGTYINCLFLNISSEVELYLLLNCIFSYKKKKKKKTQFNPLPVFFSPSLLTLLCIIPFLMHGRILT
ncbi:hypothetical protein MtrunA17_Chr6g0486431 [Medicago truncatula]|uniref:Transmembrane protein n=1 Tax=Medicago truncatula TaxID=3880 RepID=A0A396HQ72_MEDTR|nr:hypothetical protein MtrunA17_Chr6g0486431 [Medicago truncatula]